MDGNGSIPNDFADAVTRIGVVSQRPRFQMAKGHTYFWRKPGRRDEERKRFAALMRKVEAIRLRDGITKTALAAELETTTDALRNWVTGRAIGRKETVERVKDFLKRKSV